MLKRILNRLKEKCGAATIEAVVAFTGFLFVIVTILNVANYCRAQMVISNAVDAAARELAQYSYFYNMTGMEKFNNYVNENAGIGAANINDVIDGTNSVYTTLSSALSDTTDYGNQLADKVDNQNLTYQDIQTAVLKIDTNSTNIMSSITAMEAKFSSVERNPLLYMKSLAAVASGEALDLAKSYVIAAPLAKLFTSANINSGELSVQQYLENLGIVGGFEGLNFNTSTMFSPGEQDDIHLRCYYKISLCNFVDKSLFDIPICKEAHCRAWLGGDDNPVKVSQQAAVQPAPERSMPEQADASDVSGADVSGGDGETTSDDETIALLLVKLEDGDGDKEALQELVNELNASGGANYDNMLAVYKLAIEYGYDFDEFKLKSQTGNVLDTAALLDTIGHSADNYKKYEALLKSVTLDESLSLEDKYNIMKDLYPYLEYKSDIMLPGNFKYVTGIKSDGTFDYDWPENGGFENYVALSPDSIPTTWDRYGFLGGRNFSDIPEDGKYSWEQRSLPYEENLSSYHKGTIDSTYYFKVIDILMKEGSTVDDINALYKANGVDIVVDPKTFDKAIEECTQYLIDLDEQYDPSPTVAIYGLVGTVKPCFDSGDIPADQMATQFTTPISINTMMALGIAEEKHD